jgi:hypothetical protein
MALPTQFGMASVEALMAHCAAKESPGFMRSVRRFGTLFGLLFLSSCASAPPPEPAPPRAAKAPAPLTSAAPAAATESTPPLPSVTALVDLVPLDASLVASIPRIEALLGGIDEKTREGLLAELVAGLASRTGLRPELARGLVSSFDGAVLFVGSEASFKTPAERADAACLAARFRDASPFQQLLAEAQVKVEDDFFSDERLPLPHGAWLASSRVAVLCGKRDVLLTSLGVAGKHKAPFSASPLFHAERAQDAWVAIDMRRFQARSDAPPGPGSHLFLALPSGTGESGLQVDFAGYGPRYPALGTILAPTNQATLGKLPAGAIAALGLSLKRAPGKTLRSLFDELGKSGLVPADVPDALGGQLGRMGIDLGDLERVLNGDAAVGLYRDPKAKVSLDSASDLSKHSALIVVVSSTDEGAHKKIFDALIAQVKKAKKKGVSVKGNSIVGDMGDGTVHHLASKKGFVLFGMGDPKLVPDLLARFDKESLGQSTAFIGARGSVKPEANLLTYFDTQAAVDLLQAGAKPSTPASMIALALGPSDRGLELSMSGTGGMELIGTGAALAIFGVRKYLATAKTAEAKNTIGAIARDAVAAYERERFDPKAPNGPTPHKLCGAAAPVPAEVPRAKKYAPSDEDGRDFNQGDDEHGWRCLKFAMMQPMYYQYEYRVGGSYKGPARGGPDPGKDGFEVSAVGDLDGDGKTSLFTLTGKVVNGTVQLSPQIFIADELE